MNKWKLNASLKWKKKTEENTNGKIGMYNKAFSRTNLIKLITKNWFDSFNTMDRI